MTRSWTPEETDNFPAHKDRHFNHPSRQKGCAEPTASLNPYRNAGGPGGFPAGRKRAQPLSQGGYLSGTWEVPGGGNPQAGGGSDFPQPGGACRAGLVGAPAAPGSAGEFRPHL
jgi:hypothetical protein